MESQIDLKQSQLNTQETLKKKNINKLKREEEQLINEYLEYEGIVRKKTVGKGIGFNDRYFLLGPNGYSIFYYSSKNKKRPSTNDQPNGWFLIHACNYDPVPKDDKQFYIDKPGQKQWIIECATVDDRDKWLTILNFFKERSLKLLKNGDTILSSLIDFEKKGNKLEDFDDIEVLKQLQLINEKRNEKYLLKWELENQKVLRSIQLEDFIKQHSEFYQYIHYGFLFKKQLYEDLTDKAGHVLEQSEQLWFLLISEIPLVEDPDQDDDDNQEDMTLLDEDIPMGMESNIIYIFQVNEGDEKDTYQSKMVDKLNLEGIQSVTEPTYKKTGGVLEEFGKDVSKTVVKGFGALINTISTIVMLDKLIGLKINLADLKYKIVLNYFDDYKDKDQYEKYNLYSISFLQITEWYEKITKLKNYLDEKKNKLNAKIQERQKNRELFKKENGLNEDDSQSDEDFDDDLFDNENTKGQIIKQDLLVLSSIDKQGTKPKLSFNPLTNLRRLQEMGVNLAKNIAKAAVELLNQDRMIQLKRDSILVHKDKTINRIAEETIQLQEISDILPLDSTKFKIIYGIPNIYTNAITLNCNDQADRDEWIFLIKSLKSDLNTMKLTLNELYPNNNYIRNIIKFKLFGKQSLKEVKKKYPEEDLKILVKYSLFNETNQKELIDKYKHQDKKLKENEDHLLDNSATISRNSSIYTKFYYYDNKLTSGEEVKFNGDILLDIKTTKTTQIQKPKKQKINKKSKTNELFRKFCPCLFNDNEEPKKNKKNNSNMEKTPKKQPPEENGVKTPLIEDQNINL